MEIIWLVLATLILLAFWIAYWYRRRRTHRSRVSQRPHELDTKRKRLLQLVYGDEGTLKRLVEYERRRSPNKSEVALYEDAIDRLERDRS